MSQIIPFWIFSKHFKILKPFLAHGPYNSRWLGVLPALCGMNTRGDGVCPHYLLTTGESEFVSSLVSRSHPLDRHFPDLNGLRNHLALLLRCRFWLRRSRGWGLRFCTFNMFPNAAVPAAGIWGSSVITTALFRIPSEFRILGTPSPNSLEDMFLGKNSKQHYVSSCSYFRLFSFRMF